MKHEKEATVFILLGQSNAVGYATLMDEKERINKPLKNVFGLQRALNQSYHIEKLTWSGYTSAGMNLGETNEHTCSLANCLAKLWQAEIDAGNPLPDLYIVQIAIGAEGVTEKYMWYPDREEKLVPGPLGVADISLYSFTAHILSLLKSSFHSLGKEPSAIEIHWRGGEQELTVPMEQLVGLKDIYDRIFDGIQSALDMNAHYTMHSLPLFEEEREFNEGGEVRKNIHVINEAFEAEVKERENFFLFDSKTAPHYEPDSKEHGLFLHDFVHYNPKTNWWVAEEILKDFKRQLKQEEQ